MENTTGLLRKSISTFAYSPNWVVVKRAAKIKGQRRLRHV